MGEKEKVTKEIVDHIRQLVRGRDVEHSLDGATDLIGKAVLDSLNLVRLIQFIETRFGLTIGDQDIGPDLFESPASLAAYIVANRSV